MGNQAEKLSRNRIWSLEYLRILAMMMVVVLHFLGKGGLLGNLSAPALSNVQTLSWLLEAFCIVAVNVYMLISGYFLCEASFKPSRLPELLLQVWMYSVFFGLLAVVIGIVPAGEFNTYYLLQLLFPISMEHYWFMTAYVYFYVLLPFLQMAIRHMSRRQHKAVLLIVLVAFSLGKSVLPVQLSIDKKGYDCLWYLSVFLVAAYVRKYGLPVLEKKYRGLLCYILFALAIFGVTFGYRVIYLKTKSLEGILGVCYHYNHLLVLLASLGLFMAFLQWQPKVPKRLPLAKISSCTLGVYLLHENLGFRYAWPAWIGAKTVSSIPALLLKTVLAVALVFVAGILVEIIRKWIVLGIHKLLLHLPVYQRALKQMEKLDDLFAKKEPA